MTHELDGIAEKIKRANECIDNLDVEITAFFSESQYPAIPDQDVKTFQMACDYHLSREIPLRFSVLAGEIIHHLRSCFDHLIWRLSSDQKPLRDPQWIEFPVFDIKPLNKNEISGFKRKVQGVSGSVKTHIEGLQPYNLAYPQDSHLFTIHHMDRFDKHQELAMIICVFGRRMGSLAHSAFMSYKNTESREALAVLQEVIKMDSPITPQITFKEFGLGEHQAVVPSLRELSHHTQIIISEFERFFP